MNISDRPTPLTVQRSQPFLSFSGHKNFSNGRKRPQTFMGLSQTFMGLSQTFMGLSRTFMGLSQTFMGLSQTFMGLSQTFMGLSQTFMDPVRNGERL
jgi:hypothetical protein